MTNMESNLLTADISQQENPVRAALTCVYSLEQSVLEGLVHTKNKLESARRMMFSCEIDTIKRADNLISILNRRIQALTRLQCSSEAHLGKEFPYFDFEVALKWRDKEGWPSLAVYSLDSSIFKFCIRYNHIPSWISKLESPTYIPKEFLSCFEDILCQKGKMNKAFWGSPRIYAMESHFKGVIPIECRKSINDALRYFNRSDIFIVAEAVWTSKELPHADPIVIGYRNGWAWVIHTFDLTTLEAEITKQASMKLGA